MFVIAYGMVGIPCTMLAIASLGKFLASILKKSTNMIDKLLRCVINGIHARVSLKGGKTLVALDSNSDQVRTWTDALTLFVAFLTYVAIGSIVIASYEPEMNIFDAIYFNFVSLTTIGLGDLVPKNETYLVLTLVYTAVGLALTTSAIEIAAEYLRMLHYYGRTIERVDRVKIWFGGKKLTMKQLVRNLGDHFNLPVNEIIDLDLNRFVDAAIKVEAGELQTLRTLHPITLDIESIVYADADESLLNPNYPYQ